jgi:hypothetical protein
MRHAYLPAWTIICGSLRPSKETGPELPPSHHPEGCRPARGKVPTLQRPQQAPTLQQPTSVWQNQLLPPVSAKRVR